MGLYFVHTIYYNQSMFNKHSPVGRIYLNNVVVPIVTLMCLLRVVHSGLDDKQKLVLLTCLYPLKLALSTGILYLAARWMSAVDDGATA